MTTRQSTTLHISDETDDRNGLAFSTITTETGDPTRDHEPVLEVWGTVFAPDGQPLNAKMLVPMRDVRDLQSFLNDEYGRTRDENARRTTDAGSLEYYPDSTELPKASPGDLAIVQYGDQTFSGVVGEVQPNGTQSINFTGTSTEKPRQCPHISNGVQCQYADHGPETMHSYESTALFHQNDAGATTPPVYAQGATSTPQSAATDQLAAESATGASNTAVAPASQHQPDVDLFQEQAAAIQTADASADLRNEAEKIRKRRLKIEMEFDKALDAHKAAPTDQTWVALVEAYRAIEKKEPDNSRIRRGIMHLQNVYQVPGSAPTESEQTNTADIQTGPSFAPEQPQVVPNYMQQATHPVNQQFAEWADALPSEHVQDSVIVSSPAAPPTYQQTSPNTGLPQPVAALDPASQQAAAAFPCVARHSQTGQQCVRPAGHDIETPQRPPTPHMFATDLSTLGQPVPTPATPPTYVAPQQGNGFQAQGFPSTPPAQADGQPMPVAHLQAVPNQPMGLYDGEPGMPTAPAMPTWQAPQQ